MQCNLIDALDEHLYHAENNLRQGHVGAKKVMINLQSMGVLVYGPPGTGHRQIDLGGSIRWSGMIAAVSLRPLLGRTAVEH